VIGGLRLNGADRFASLKTVAVLRQVPAPGRKGESLWKPPGFIGWKDYLGPHR
jgi:hypothetical protein